MNIPVFVISLTDNNDRREHMARLLSDHHIAFEFFDAFDGRGQSTESITSLYSDTHALQTLGYKLIGSQVATVISHLNIYKHILSTGYSCALILEDDIRITRPITPIFDTIEALPANWDVVSLCYYRNSNTLRHYVISLRKRRLLSDRYHLAFFTQCMHSTAAYLISAKGAAKLVSTLESGFCEPIDHYVGNIHALHLYAIVPKPVEIDLQLGLASNVSRERLVLSGPGLTTGDRLRLFLRSSGMFPLAKRINLGRLEWQKPISQALYVLSHPWLLLRLTKHAE
jgi:glycosyl transferase family 25